MENNPYSLIVYIATGPYRRFFYGFLQSIHNFLPGVGKIVTVYTDDPKDLEGVIPRVREFSPNLPEVRIKLIEHKPWPLNALLKFQYISDAIGDYQETYREKPVDVFYMDSKVAVRAPFNPYKEAEKLDKVKCKPWNSLIAVPHNLLPDYPNHFHLAQWWYLNKDTNANIEGDYLYCQSGFFGGAGSKMLEACNTMKAWVENDFANHRLPAVDDESYWNRYIYDHSDIVNILPFGYWGCPSDPECRWKDAILEIRDHSEIEYHKYCVKKGVQDT